MLDKNFCPQIEEKLSVFFDFRLKLMILMAVKTLKIFFRNFFEHKSNLSLLSFTDSQSQ